MAAGRARGSCLSATGTSVRYPCPHACTFGDSPAPLRQAHSVALGGLSVGPLRVSPAPASEWYVPPEPAICRDVSRSSNDCSRTISLGMRDVLTLPKTNLHVHLENAVRTSTLRDIAARNGTALPRQLLDERCVVTDFADFFIQSKAARTCLVEAEDFWQVAYEFCADEAAQGVRYAEVTFSAAAHGERVGDPEKPLLAVIDGLAAGEAAFGIRCRLVLDHSRRRPVERSWRTLELALEHLDVVVALGLGGDDAYPAEPFREVFETATSAGLRSVPHAGEAAGPESVRDAVRLLHADRIGHGIRVVDDPALADELRDAGIPLEVCPSSNVALGLVPSLAAHPLPRLVEAGLTVTLNTDIPTMTGVRMAAEYENARRAFGFDDADLAFLAVAGVDASFAPSALQDTLRQEIQGWLDQDPNQSRSA